MGVSLIINHLIGLVILSLILLLGRRTPAINGPGRKVPWYLMFNGLFGLAILNLNYTTVVHTGASLAMLPRCLARVSVRWYSTLPVGWECKKNVVLTERRSSV